jgi:hypothetical protein
MLEKRIMTASTPIVRYYDHLRFVYEVESRMRELRQSTEPEQQSQPKSEQPAAPNGDGVSHRKDGGSKLNPNDAPQQTVNPPAPLWGGDTLEAKLRMQPRSFENQGFPTHHETSDSIATGLTEAGVTETGSIETRVLAMPERSTSCIA